VPVTVSLYIFIIIVTLSKRWCKRWQPRSHSVTRKSVIIITVGTVTFKKSASILNDSIIVRTTRGEFVFRQE
jgi:hypothetical protein